MDNKTQSKEISLDTNNFQYEETTRCYIVNCDCGSPVVFVEELLKDNKIIITCEDCKQKYNITNYNHLLPVEV